MVMSRDPKRQVGLDRAIRVSLLTSTAAFNANTQSSSSSSRPTVGAGDIVRADYRTARAHMSIELDADKQKPVAWERKVSISTPSALHPRPSRAGERVRTKDREGERERERTPARPSTLP